MHRCALLLGGLAVASGTALHSRSDPSPFAVGLLSDHDGSAWGPDANCSSTVACNIELFEKAVDVAVAQVRVAEEPACQRKATATFKGSCFGS